MRLEVRVWANETGYKAVCSDLPECAALGPSRESAVSKLYALVQGEVEERRKLGMPLPAGNRADASDIIHLEVR